MPDLVTFKLKRGPQTRTTKGIFQHAREIKNPADLPPWYIRGIKAASKEEYWVSLALTRLEKSEGLTWKYQVPIYGGRTTAGGTVVDFVVFTPGRNTWLDPMGRYWHTGRHEDREQMRIAAYRSHANLIAWFTDETQTKEIMYNFLKTHLGY